MNTSEDEEKNINHLFKDAKEQAAILIKDAAEQAAILPKEAAEKAARVLVEAAVKAAVLPKEAAEKAALLPKEAAEKAAHILQEAAEKAAILPITAADKAVLLLKSAAEKASNLPKDSAHKATLLFNDATEKAVFILKEEAEILAAKKIQFLDIAAHELRNPITSISFLLQVVERQAEKGQPLDVNILKRLRAPIDRLARLVVDLLDMSKLERKLFVAVPVRTNIITLIYECVEEFKIQIPDRNFIFIKPDRPVEIDIDPVKISQVLVNLLDNAVTYTSKGDIEVTILDLKDLVRVSVIDHGLGIPKEKQELLFTAFTRGSSNETVHVSGLGLGLSICHAILDLHQGTIGVSSQVGKGSTFYFELPKKRKEL